MDPTSIPGSIRDLAALLLLYRIAYIVGPRLVAWHVYGAELLEALAKKADVQLPQRPSFLGSEASMFKRIATPLLLVLVALGAVLLPGCSALSIDASAPAFVRDVDQVRTDADQADAKLREDLGTDVARLREDTTAGMLKLREDLSAADARILEDVAAARQAGAAAEARAIAEGRSHAEAIAERVREENAAAELRNAAALAKAKLELVDAQAAAEKRSADAVKKAAADAADAKDRAEGAATAATAAREESSSSSTPWWLAGGTAVLLGLLQRFGLAGVIKHVGKAIAEYDAAPYEGPGGVRLTEAALVQAAGAVLAAGAAKAPPPG